MPPPVCFHRPWTSSFVPFPDLSDPLMFDAELLFLPDVSAAASPWRWTAWRRRKRSLLTRDSGRAAPSKAEWNKTLVKEQRPIWAPPARILLLQGRVLRINVENLVIFLILEDSQNQWLAQHVNASIRSCEALNSTRRSQSASQERDEQRKVKWIKPDGKISVEDES